MDHLRNLTAIEEPVYSRPGTESPQDNSGSEGMLRAIWEKRRFIWRLTVSAFLLSVVVAFLWPKTWVSAARLMPPDKSSTSAALNLAALASKVSSDAMPLADMFETGSSGAVFVGILRSTTVSDRLINQFDLRNVYSVRSYMDARRILTDRTDIAEDRKSGIITVAVRDRDPVRARNLAQAYVDELNKLVAELSTSSARRERIFLEDRLKTVQATLEIDEKQLGEFSSKHTTFDLGVQGKAILESAAVLQGQLIATESELRGLSAIYTPSNVRVRAAQARADELRNQLNKLGGSNVAANPATEQSENGDFAYPSIKQLPLLGSTWADYYRQVKVQEAVFETLTKQYELAKVQEAKEIPTVKELDIPLVPERKAAPKRLQVIFAITTLGALLGIGWIWALRFWQRVPEDNENKMLALEVYATTRASLRPALQKLGRLVPISRRKSFSDLQS